MSDVIFMAAHDTSYTAAPTCKILTILFQCKSQDANHQRLWPVCSSHPAAIGNEAKHLANTAATHGFSVRTALPWHIAAWADADHI